MKYVTVDTNAHFWLSPTHLASRACTTAINHTHLIAASTWGAPRTVSDHAVARSLQLAEKCTATAWPYKLFQLPLYNQLEEPGQTKRALVVGLVLLLFPSYIMLALKALCRYIRVFLVTETG